MFILFFVSLMLTQHFRRYGMNRSLYRIQMVCHFWFFAKMLAVILWHFEGTILHWFAFFATGVLSGIAFWHDFKTYNTLDY